MAESTDEELVRQIQEGQVLLFEILVRRYQKRLLNFTLRLVREEKMAEDIVQDSFLKTYQAIGRIDTDRKFSTFLFEVAKNTAFSYLRKTKLELPLLDQQLIDTHEEVSEKLDKEIEKESVNSALNQMPKNYQKVIRLYYFQDLSYEQISKNLQIPINTVRTHLRRAKDHLKKLLNRTSL